MGFKSPRPPGRVEARLSDLPIPDPWDINAFLGELAERRGRAMELLPMPPLAGTESVCGTTVPLPEADVIFVKWHTSTWHREHAILHECGHIICGHPPSPGALAVWIGQLLPADRWPDPSKIAGVLLRSRYDTPVEREAERVAQLIEERANRRSKGPSTATASEPPEVLEGLERLARALGVPGR